MGGLVSEVVQFVWVVQHIEELLFVDLRIANQLPALIADTTLHVFVSVKHNVPARERLSGYRLATRPRAAARTTSMSVCESFLGAVGRAFFFRGVEMRRISLGLLRDWFT